MLEQIHAAAEDQRKTQAIVAIGLVAFGIFALTSAMSGIGLLAAIAGGGMLAWTRSRVTFAPKRFAH